MKKIWINLELYFKRYDFYNFLGFFWIFSDFIFDFKPFLNKQKIKIGLILARAPRGCDVSRKATWQRHADPRSAYVAYCMHDIFYLYYI